jgi:hypothetical protein
MNALFFDLEASTGGGFGAFDDDSCLQRSLLWLQLQEVSTPE